MYQDTRLTVSDSVNGSATITIYDSVALEAPLNHSDILWFEYGILANANSDNTLTIEYTNDNGTTWNSYRSINIGTSFTQGEVFIGHFEHVRITFTAGTSNVTSFFCNVNLKAGQRSSNTTISFSPSNISKIVAWGDPTLESGGSTPDNIAGAPAWTSATPPSTTTVAGQKVLSFNGTDQFIRKDTSAIPSNNGAGFAAWCNLTAADATELLFDAGTTSLRVFRTTTTTFVRAVGTVGGLATSQDFRFPNTELDGDWHFFYVGIRGSDSVCLIDGSAPSGLTTVNNSGENEFPDSLGSFSTTTTIGADTSVPPNNEAQLLLGQFYGLAGEPLTTDEHTNLMNFRSLAGA